MKAAKRLTVLAAALSAIVGAGLAVHTMARATTVPSGVAEAPAVIGGGWTQYTPDENLQIETHDVIHSFPGSTTHQASAGGSYDRVSGVETFKLFNHVSNRVEKRSKEEYSSGMRQFEGDLMVSGPTNNESVMQIFGRVGGASMLMIRAYAAKGGTLRALGMGATLATGIYGKWVHINVIHDATANKVSIYIDGKLVGTWNSAPGTHYFKYGVYGSLKTATAQSQWKNVNFYKK